MKQPFTLLALSCIAFSTAFSTALAPAVAQDTRALERKVERLEKELNAVQRKVFSGGDSRFFEGQSPGVVDQPVGESGTSLLADLQVRVGTLERRLRELTGQIEEAGHRNTQLVEEMRRFREDMEFRISRLEQGGNVPANATPNPAPATDETGNTGLPLIPSTTPSEDPKDAFNTAFKMMSQGDYEAAERGFKGFLERYRDNPLASNAQYWLGRTYLVQKDYPKAAAAFFAGHRDYPEGAKAPQNLLGLSTALYELGQKDEACSALDLLRSGYQDAGDDVLQRMTAERTRMGCT